MWSTSTVRWSLSTLNCWSSRSHRSECFIVSSKNMWNRKEMLKCFRPREDRQSFLTSPCISSRGETEMPIFQYHVILYWTYSARQYMFTGPDVAVTASALDRKHTGGVGSVFVGKTRQQGEEWREGTEAGSFQAFCLCCHVEEKGRSSLLKFLERTITFPTGSEKASTQKVKIAAPSEHCKIGN